MLAPVELDFLHSLDEVYQVALVGRVLCEEFVVEGLTPLHKEPHPRHIECTSDEEDGEDAPVVDGDDDAEDDDVEDGEERNQAGVGEKVLYARVIADALQDVAHLLCVEIGDG